MATSHQMMFFMYGQNSRPSASDWFDIKTWVGSGGASKTVSSLDLSDGGMVWVKRTDAAGDNRIYFKQASGGTVYFYVNNGTVAPVSSSATLDASGFTVPDDISGATYVAWVFKKQANCFDIVDYTGTGLARTVTHSLGEAPGMMIVGRYSGTSSKVVYHNGVAATQRGVLNNNGGWGTDTTYWNSTAATSSVFTVGTNTNTNQSGVGYFAFLFADNGSCATGSYAGSASAVDLAIGFQPRFIVVKSLTGSRDWVVFDTTRTPSFSGLDEVARWNSSVAASTNPSSVISYITDGVRLEPAFTLNTDGETFVYLAIR